MHHPNIHIVSFLQLFNQSSERALNLGGEHSWYDYVSLSTPVSPHKIIAVESIFMMIPIMRKPH